MRGLPKALMTQDEFETYLKRRGFKIRRHDVPIRRDHAHDPDRYIVNIVTDDEHRELWVLYHPECKYHGVCGSVDFSPFTLHDDYWGEDNELGYKTIGALIRKIRYNLSGKRAATY